MKTHHRYTAAVLLAVALGGLAACGATPTSSSTGQYLDDTAITTKVKTAIFNDASLKSAEINVETFKGTVQLSGFVGTQADITRAVTLAQGIDGVRAVKNDMRLK